MKISANLVKSFNATGGLFYGQKVVVLPPGVRLVFSLASQKITVLEHGLKKMEE